MSSKTVTFRMVGIFIMAFATIAFCVSFSWAQDLRASSSSAAAGTSSPLLQYGLAVSGNDVRANAEMIAVRQDRNSSGIITTTRYHERVSASGDIDKFNVSFHYKSLPAASDTSGRVQSILNSPSIFGSSSLWDAGFSTDPASQSALPWYAQ